MPLGKSWWDGLRADAVFGARQLRKHKVASAAAILSLGMAAGACASAFRIIDAMLLRPMPIQHPEALYAMFTLGYDPGGHLRLGESNEYPQFQAMRKAVADEAELIAVSYGERVELSYGGGDEIERAHRQYVSGWMFGSFGLKPALGRLLQAGDDDVPGAHPVAVLSYDYWTRRFGRDPKAVGRSFAMGSEVYRVVGVGPEGFTGTEPGTMTDIFVPTMMYAGVRHSDWSWLRTFVRMKAGGRVETVRDRLQAVFQAVQVERAKGFVGWPKKRLENFLHQKIEVLPASGGLSVMRQESGRALVALGVLVALVLLVACANVANLLACQAAGRAREMAVRAAIGAGRGRLAQLMMVESGLVAGMAGLVGAGLAWWSAPAVVARIQPAEDPARLALPVDWRVIGFGLALTAGIALAMGLPAAIRAAAGRPLGGLKGGDLRARRRLMHGLTAAQVGVCCVVLVVAGLLVKSFERLVNQPLGFSSGRLLALEVESKPAQAEVYWTQVAERLAEAPGVERTALAGWPLLSGLEVSGFVSVNGAAAGDRLAYFLNVSPGWLETMKIPLIEGRDFRPEDEYPGAAIVNRAFAKEYFGGVDPVGRWFVKGAMRMQVVGLAADARFQSMREPIMPVAYVPFRLASGAAIGQAAILVKTASANPLAVAEGLRREVTRARTEFRVSNIRTQEEIDRSQTLRERLLAGLAVFFGAVALAMAGIGLYGVLDYSVIQRRREIGIRMAVGAGAGRVAGTVVGEILGMAALGAAGGTGIGIAAARYGEALLYGVKPQDAGVMAAAAGTMMAAAALAAIAPVARAVKTDPMAVLRDE